MDFEKRAKRQSFRIIISETIMVLTVIIMVAVLALAVSGYWLGSDFQVERQGMLQISSAPTGASVAVDGDAPWYQRTNTSKVLPAGEHHIVLTYDGYDAWEKTVSINEGLLYRLHYPRLFLLEREKESVYDVTSVTFASVSDDHGMMLLIDNTTTWALLNLESDKLEPKTIDIAPYFTSVSLADGAKAGLFTGSIVSAQWSGDRNHILIESRSGDATEWVLLDVKTPKNSINLTREFAVTFTDVRIFDNSASNLLALRSGNLHKIDVSARQISAAMARNVASYSFYNQDILFIGDEYLGITKLNDAEPTIIKRFVTEEPLTTSQPGGIQAQSSVADQSDQAAKIGSSSSTSPTITAMLDRSSRAFLSRFYDTKYLTIVTGDQLSIYKYDDYSEVASLPIGFTPEKVTVGAGGDFVFMNTGTAVAVFDMEAQQLVSWTLESTHYDWLDGNMLYAVQGGSLSVYDYDGLNHRVLSSNVSSHFPVTIAKNRWLYYFADDEIIREIIAK